MARTMWIGTAALALVACGSPDPGSDPQPNPDAPTYPSDFSEGKYRVLSLALLPEGQGADFDGDGEPDNNLPNALTAADQILRDEDLSPDTFNERIELAIASGDLNLLLDVRYVAGELTVDILSGYPTVGRHEPIEVDPSSYGDDGDPLTRLVGEFLTQRDMSVRADAAVLPVPFLPDQPPSMVPMRRMSLTGTAAVDGDVVGVVAGAIPALALADDVLADLIPPEGIGNLSREQLLRTLRAFANLETIADIDLGDGERAVSCALAIRAEPATW
jgi:hypothetical protein